MTGGRLTVNDTMLKKMTALLLVIAGLGLHGAVVSAATTDSVGQYDRHLHDLRQIVYELEIVEITDSESFRAGLLDVESRIGPAGEAVLRVLVDPSMMQFLRGVAQSLRIELGRETASSQRVASPWLVTAIGRSAGLRVVQQETIVFRDERTLYNTVHGIDLRVTPLRFDEAKARVLSTITVETFSGESQLETELWVGAAEPELIAVLEQQGQYVNNRWLRHASGAERRYYALYVTARPAADMSAASVVAVGSVRGLGDLLWTRRMPPRTGWVDVAFGLRSPSGVSVNWTGWATHMWRWSLTVDEHAQPGRHELATERLLWRDEWSQLLLGLHVLNYPGTEGAGLFAAVSLSEQLALSPRFRIGAGYAPLVYSIDTGALARDIWWANVEYGQRSAIRIGYRSDVEQRLQATWRLPLSNKTSLQLSYNTEGRGTPGMFSLGLHWAFSQ